MDANLACPFSKRTLLREFPQFAVTPTARDAGRNTCSTHSNGRRRLRALQKVGVLANLPVSCRSIASLGLCKGAGFDSTISLTWDQQCCVDVHKDCPVQVTSVPDHLKDRQVSVLLWSVKEDPDNKKDKNGKTKKVCGLFSSITTVQKLAEDFDKSVVNLKRHIFTANWEFSVLRKRTEHLEMEDLITIEDYQQNLSLFYREMTTSMAYSANVVQIMIYPMALRYLVTSVDENNVIGTRVAKAFVVFLSKDLKHDHQQVLAMEKRMFNIVENKLGRVFRNWLRKSDGCSSQFKSRFSTSQLLNMGDLLEKDLNKVEFQYFETDEGKNESDMAGALVKSWYEKGVMRPVEECHEAPRTTDEVVAVIQANMGDDLSKIDFFHVEAFPDLDRERTPPAAVLTGIRQLHSLTKRADGTLLGKKLSCSRCKVSTVCASCVIEKASKLKLIDGDNDTEEIQEEQEDEVVVTNNENENAEDGSSEAEQEEEQENDSEVEEDDEGFAPGSIVWVKIGRLWFPSKVIPPDDVAEVLSEGFMFVRRFDPFGDIQRVPLKNIDALAENRIDAQRSAKNDEINLAYGLALSDLLGDVL